MIHPRFRILYFLSLVLVPMLACQTFAGGTPQPAETLNALYTSAAQTLVALSTDAVYTQTAQPLATNTLVIYSASSAPSR